MFESYEAHKHLVKYMKEIIKITRSAIEGVNYFKSFLYDNNGKIIDLDITYEPKDAHIFKSEESLTATLDIINHGDIGWEDWYIESVDYDLEVEDFKTIF